jgi:hypothetical protein
MFQQCFWISRAVNHEEYCLLRCDAMKSGSTLLAYCFFWVYFLTINMKAVFPIRTQVNFRNTSLHIPQDSYLYGHWWNNLKVNTKLIIFKSVTCFGCQYSLQDVCAWFPHLSNALSRCSGFKGSWSLMRADVIYNKGHKLLEIGDLLQGCVHHRPMLLSSSVYLARLENPSRDAYPWIETAHITQFMTLRNTFANGVPISYSFTSELRTNENDKNARLYRDLISGI